MYKVGYFLLFWEKQKKEPSTETKNGVHPPRGSCLGRQLTVLSFISSKNSYSNLQIGTGITCSPLMI